jgi:hypothetical protein
MEHPPDAGSERSREERLGAEHVGAHERGTRLDRPVHVSLCRQMHDRVDSLERALHRKRIANVTLQEAVAGMLGHTLQVLEIPRVGEQVEVDDLDVAPFREEQANQVRTDESGAAGDQDAQG